VPTLVDRRVSRGQHGGSPTVINLSFLDAVMYAYTHYVNMHHMCKHKLHNFKPIIAKTEDRIKNVTFI
jgi:hypothetical protein